MDTKKRLEELRIVLRSENISYGELQELQSLAEHIAPDDVELLEAAGVPEGQEDTVDTRKLELQEGSEDIKIIDVGSDNGDELGAIFLTGDEDFDKEDRKPFAAELVKRYNAYLELVAKLEAMVSEEELCVDEPSFNARSARAFLSTLNTH